MGVPFWRVPGISLDKMEYWNLVLAGGGKHRNIEFTNAAEGLAKQQHQGTRNEYQYSEQSSSCATMATMVNPSRRS